MEVFSLKPIQMLQRCPCSFFLRSVFSMLDITKKGYISLEQYTAAMSSLRVAKYNVKPAGWEFNKISQETFARETRTALRNNTATYADH